MENAFCDNIDNTILPPTSDEDDEYDDFDDEFCSDSYDLFQSIEDRGLLDPEDDELEDKEIESYL